ncbi:MAG: acyl-CoA dehydrogenase, partial [Muribaculum sp.]|nr:acyl-CoA dehydrogenase [Muribaculum sp.]
PINDALMKMTEVYANAVEKVVAAKDSDYLDFMARRLVEMAGNIIMSYLLILDATRDEQFAASAKVYFNIARAEVAKHAEFIDTFTPDEVNTYRKE